MAHAAKDQQPPAYAAQQHQALAYGAEQQQALAYGSEQHQAVAYGTGGHEPYYLQQEQQQQQQPQLEGQLQLVPAIAVPQQQPQQQFSLQLQPQHQQQQQPAYGCGPFLVVGGDGGDQVPFLVVGGDGGEQATAGPFGRQGLECQQGVGDQFAPQAQQPRTVHLRGLPNTICVGSIMDVVLEQAGFQGLAQGVKAQTGDPCGEALLTFACHQVAERCVHHFDGCQWDESGTIVTACLTSETAEHNIEEAAVFRARDLAMEDHVERVLAELLSPSALCEDSREPALGKRGRKGPPVTDWSHPPPMAPCAEESPSDGGEVAAGRLWSKGGDSMAAGEESTDAGAGSSEAGDSHESVEVAPEWSRWVRGREESGEC